MGKNRKPQVSKYDETISAANSVAALWMDFRKYLRKGLRNQEILPEDEQRFLEVKSELARLQRFLGQKLPEGLLYGSKNIAEVMTSSISIGTVHDLPSADKRGLYERWHECYVAIQRLLGTLDVLRDGYPAQFQIAKARSINVKESIGLVAAKKRSAKKMLGVALVIVAGAAAAYYVMSQ
jgi:hypothetical protein